MVTLSISSFIDLMQHELDAKHELHQSRIVYAGAIFCTIAYYTLSPYFKTAKQKSWVLSACVSPAMTLFSLPYNYHFFTTGSVQGLRIYPELSYATCRWFQAFLIVDTIIGVMHYRSEMDMVSGWGHHVFYVAALNIIINNGWDHIFTLASILELPTFILALSILYPKTRNNVFFAVVFFILRIVLNSIYLVLFALPENRQESVAGSWGPFMILGLALAMHAFWFRGLIKGFYRRARQAKEKKQAVANGNGVH